MLMGPGIPVPVPEIVANSIANIQVTNSTERNGFQITFNVDKKSELLKTMLTAGFFEPLSTWVMFIYTLYVFPYLLIDEFLIN